MKSAYLLREPEAWKRLAENLTKCREVVKLDHDQEREAWTLAHAFSDLEESFRKLLDEYLPELMAPEIKGEHVRSLLLDVGEELRHILYHIKDSQFFVYLSEPPETLSEHPDMSDQG